MGPGGRERERERGKERGGGGGSELGSLLFLPMIS
jgi:hypothetical protein